MVVFSLCWTAGGGVMWNKTNTALSCDVYHHAAVSATWAASGLDLRHNSGTGVC